MRRVVGRHRRIRLRAEFRTWVSASRSARRSSLAAFAARRRVRVAASSSPRSLASSETRWVDSPIVARTDAREGHAAPRGSPRVRHVAIGVARPLASKTNATRAPPPSRRSTRFARASRRDWRCRPHFAARFARGRVAATFRVARARRFVSRRRRERRRRAAEARGENRADLGDARVSSDETPRRGWRRRSRFERRGFSPRMAPTFAFRATRLLAVGARGGNPGRDGRRKNNDKNSRARNATSPGVARRGTTRVRDRSPGTPGGLVRLRIRKRRRSAVPGNPRRRRG